LEACAKSPPSFGEIVADVKPRRSLSGALPPLPEAAAKEQSWP
jgi:hypothetical protein